LKKTVNWTLLGIFLLLGCSLGRSEAGELIEINNVESGQWLQFDTWYDVKEYARKNHLDLVHSSRFLRQSEIHLHSENGLNEFFNKNATSQGYSTIVEALKWSQQKPGSQPLDYVITHLARVIGDKRLTQQMGGFRKDALKEEILSKIKAKKDRTRKIESVLQQKVSVQAQAQKVERRIKELEKALEQIGDERTALLLSGFGKQPSHSETRSQKHLTETYSDLQERLTEYQRSLSLLVTRGHSSVPVSGRANKNTEVRNAVSKGDDHSSSSGSAL